MKWERYVQNCLNTAHMLRQYTYTGPVVDIDVNFSKLNQQAIKRLHLARIIRANLRQLFIRFDTSTQQLVLFMQLIYGNERPDEWP